MRLADAGACAESRRLSSPCRADGPDLAVPCGSSDAARKLQADPGRASGSEAMRALSHVPLYPRQARPGRAECCRPWSCHSRLDQRLKRSRRLQSQYRDRRTGPCHRISFPVRSQQSRARQISSVHAAPNGKARQQGAPSYSHAPALPAAYGSNHIRPADRPA